MEQQQPKTRNSGFASMEMHKQREIARKGGMAAHRRGTAHEFTSEEARNAGRKGGERVSANRSHMVEIGRLGGRKSAQRRRTVVPQEMARSESDTRESAENTANNPDMAREPDAVSNDQVESNNESEG